MAEEARVVPNHTNKTNRHMLSSGRPKRSVVDCPGGWEKNMEEVGQHVIRWRGIAALQPDYNIDQVQTANFTSDIS